MTVLAHVCCLGNKPLEVPIETIYIDGNRASHFNPVSDSMRIYFVLMRVYFAAILAADNRFCRLLRRRWLSAETETAE